MPIIKCPYEDCGWESDNLDGTFAAVLAQQLSMHDKAAHSAPVPTVVPQKLKIDSPEIGVNATPEEWDGFCRQWSMYKTGTVIATPQVATALFYCCSEELRMSIMRDTRQDVSLMPEADLLSTIKRLAVRDESILVHRMKLAKMTQGPGMGIRTFLANLRGQAALCKFTVECTVPGCSHTFDYSNEIIKDNLIRGISDPDILADLLGDPRTDQSLEEVVNFVAQKEQGKATRHAVGDSAGAINQVREKSQPQTFKQKYKTEGKGKCWACGGPSHGQKNDRATRAQKCPAWTSTCSKCTIRGHFSKMCNKCNDCGAWGHKDNTSRFCKQNSRANGVEDIDENLFANTAQLGAINSVGQTVAHHIYQGKWIQRPSKPHPTVLAELTPLPDEHAHFGHKIQTRIKFKPVTVPMIADSGCQSSIIPLDTALAMGYQRRNFMPVSLAMRGAIQEDLGVEGGIICKISIKDDFGQERHCKSMIYLSSKMTKAFLCREALEQLGIISCNFPDPIIDKVGSTSCASQADIQCDCPRRTSEMPPLPTSLPPGLTATDKDVPALKEWLLNYYGSTTFNTCVHQPLPMMKCEPLKLFLNPDAKPVAVHKPAVVPIHWQEKVQSDLERDVALEVLEKVQPNTPVTWCSRMVVTSKADGTPRRTVDLQPQNKQSVRQTHHTSTPFKLAEQVPKGTKKSVTDAWNGYHSVPLCKEDRHITTFITPWGRYRYKVAPQGFLASGDGYTQRFDAIISDFENKVKCVDDTLMWEKGVEEAFHQTCRWLDLCGKNGITLNPKKFQFAQDVVDFSGLTITLDSIKPQQKFLDSILQFPTPKDITGARAWFGLVNQGSYAFAMAKEMKPFRELLKTGKKFEWTDDLETAFKKSKTTIVDAMKEGVQLFECSRPTCLATDWSREGIGFVLKQKHCLCPKIAPNCCHDGWKLCLVGSRFTTPAESRYAPVEGEALAVAYALHQTRYYILGCSNLTVLTDHKPLVQIFNDRSLTDITNRRLLNLKEKTLPYSFTIQHISGAKNKGPDAVSRYPLLTPSCEKEENLADDMGVQAAAITTLYVASNLISWDMVKKATAEDDTLTHLKEVLSLGMPGLHDLRQDIKPYHRYASHLYEIDGVVMMNNRIVIPVSLREQLLQALHAAHQGVGAMCQRAADSIFWPNISVDITRIRNECHECHRMAKSNAMEPPEDIIPPEFPFQKVCCDFFTFLGQNYLVLVDRYSNWPIVFKQPGKAEQLVSRLRDIFETFGVPEELTSDGGPQFTSSLTEEFLKSWGVHHRLVSVANPHGNSRAEIAVKTVKRMLQANTNAVGSLNVDAFQRALLIYRNSIDPETKSSPAMILFGRPIRDPIPAPLGKYCPHQTWQETITNREKAMAIRHSREQEKWSEHTRALKDLAVGDHVYVQNVVGNNPLKWERTGTVIEVLPYKQYRIKLDGSGRTTLRNRRHLRKFTPFYSKLVQPTNPVKNPAIKATLTEESKSITEPQDETSSAPNEIGQMDPDEWQQSIQENNSGQPAVAQTTIPNEAVGPAATQTSIPHEAGGPAGPEATSNPQPAKEKSKEVKIALALRRLFSLVDELV